MKHFTKQKLKVQFPLFWKFTLSIILVVLVFGTLNVLIVRNSVTSSLENELEKKGLFMAKSIAEKSVSLVLFDDIPGLYMLIDNIIKIDSSINYIFIVNGNNEILAHSFDYEIPKQLLKINRLNDGQEDRTVLLKNTSQNNEIIRDIAVPVLSNSIAVIHVGLKETKIQKEISKTISNIILMIIIFLIVGILTALIYSYFITSPIKHLSKVAGNIDINSLHEYDFEKIEYKREISTRLKRTLKLYDEIDLLYDNFNEMLFRLEKTHKELQETQASLLHSERLASIGTLTAGLAHEINNPIAGIKNCIKRLIKNPENLNQNTEYLNLISEASHKIENVLKGLLNFSRKQEYKFKPADIRPLIENAINLVSFELEKHHIVIFKNYEPDIPQMILSAGHIEQVIINLLINSIDSIKEKSNSVVNHSGKITFTLKMIDPDLIFMIEDNGVGIMPEKLRTIFDPFYTTKDIGEGTGLGLYISYKIINAHNGEIFANSHDGITQFILKLPLN